MLSSLMHCVGEWQSCVNMCCSELQRAWTSRFTYGVAKISRLLKITCLVCRISSLLCMPFANSKCMLCTWSYMSAHTATHCNTHLQMFDIKRNLHFVSGVRGSICLHTRQRTATHHTTLHHVAPHCNTHLRMLNVDSTWHVDWFFPHYCRRFLLLYYWQ